MYLVWEKTIKFIAAILMKPKLKIENQKKLREETEIYEPKPKLNYINL